MSDAATIAKVLGGHRAGDRYLCRCPLPGHGRGCGDRHPSLSVRDGDKRLLVRCYAGCDARDVLDELRRRGLIDKDQETPSWRRSTRSWAAAPAKRVHEPDAAALALWRSGCPATGTLIETYLKGRGITLTTPSSIRFGIIFHFDRVEMPVMIAAVQRPGDGKIIAVQRTLLTWTGKKAAVSTPRKTLGALGHGAVRLAMATEVLGLAEGVEDALAAMQLSGVPCWACLGANRMNRVAVPEHVRELHIFADDDEPGRLGAERTAERHCAEGRRVVLRLPPIGLKDFTDIVAAKEGAAA